MNKNEYSKYKIIYADTVSKVSMNSESYLNQYSKELSNFILSNINKYDDNIFIANSLATLKAIDNISNEYPNSKFLLYTHIGDLLCDNDEFYDFPKEDVDNFIKIINNNKKIMVGTQSYELANYLGGIFEKVRVLYEPIIQSDTFSNITGSFNNILAIASNYKRKRLDLIIKFAGILRMPLKILCTKKQGYYDLQLLATKYGTKIQILENIPNKDILFHIKTSKILLHFSEIEFFPYSILECASYIPCLINSDSNWGKLFPEFVNKISLHNSDEAIKDSILETIKQKPKLDLKEYQQKCEEQWRKFINE